MEGILIASVASLLLGVVLGRQCGRRDNKPRLGSVGVLLKTASVKMVLVVRDDLKMGKGKIGA